jgi:hypothetical protein
MQDESAAETTPLDALARSLQAWDLSPEAAASLRKSLAGLSAPHRKPATAAERAVLLAASAWARKTPPSIQRLEANGGELASLFGPFIGAAELGRWPFSDPERISDDEAARWLPLVGKHALVTEETFRFVVQMFGVRRREVWVPAARALAEMALRDERPCELLRASWSAADDHGFPSSRRQHSVTSPRHLLVAAAAWLARGGAPGVVGGLTAELVARPSLPAQDASDASAALLALAELIDGETSAAAALDALPARLAELGADEQQEAAMRSILTLPRVRAVPELRARGLQILTRPRWLDCKSLARADQLWSWLLTAQHLAAERETALLEEMHRSAGPGLAALRLRLTGELPGGSATPVDAALPRLRLLLDPDIRETTASSSLALALVELLLLLEVHQDELADLPWRALVRRAVGDAAASAALDGAAGEVARADLALVLSRSDAAVAVLLRTAILPQAIVLQLARSRNGFIARQVAVQAERLLRQTESPLQQLDFLLALFDQTPPAGVFDELGATLRGDASPLHHLVHALGSLDGERGRLSRIESRLAAIATAAQELTMGPTRPSTAPDAVTIERLSAALQREHNEVASDPAHPRHRLRGVLAQVFGRRAPPGPLPEHARARVEEAIRGLDALPEPRLDELAEAARLVLVPHNLPAQPLVTDVLLECTRHGMSLLYHPTFSDAAVRKALRAFLLGDAPGLGVRALLAKPERLDGPVRRLDAALAIMADTAPAVTAADCAEVSAAVSDLDGALGRPVWPIGALVEAVIQELQTFAATCSASARKTALVSERLHHAVARADEAELLALSADQSVLALLPRHDVGVLHEFLLSHLLVGPAHALRRQVRSRVQLSAVWTVFLPQVLVTAGGVFLIMEHGEGWIKRLDEGGRGFWQWAFPAIAVVFTFAVLCARFGSHLVRPAQMSAWRHWLTVLVRAGALFLLLHAVALASAIIGLVSEGQQVGGRLGLIFVLSWVGMFFGLIVESVLHPRGASGH